MMHLNVTTNQQAFDKGVQHMIDMIYRCTDMGGCVYRDRRGGRCVVGALIDDDVYDAFGVEDLARLGEDTSISSLIGNEMIDIGEVDASLLAHLQTVHDNESTWINGGGVSSKALRRLAESVAYLSLDVAVITNELNNRQEATK